MRCFITVKFSRHIVLLLSNSVDVLGDSGLSNSVNLLDVSLLRTYCVSTVKFSRLIRCISTIKFSTFMRCFSTVKFSRLTRGLISVQFYRLVRCLGLLNLVDLLDVSVLSNLVHL